MRDEPQQQSEPDANATMIQVWTQRLGAISGECAHAFQAVSGHVATALPGDAFACWAEHGLALAQGGWRGWECAVWYFRLSPQFLARLHLDDLVRLSAPTQRVLAVSPQLSIDLLRGAARFIERDRPISVADWAASGERLIQVGRSGRLATAYFEASPEVLSLTGRGEFRAWLELVQTLAISSEAAALDVVRHSVPRLANIPPLARLQALRLAQTMARWTPATTDDLLRTLAVALHAVRAGLHQRLLDLALRVAETAPPYLDRLLKATARVFQGLPEAEQDLLLGQIWRVALLDAKAGTLLCDYLPDVLRQLTARDVEAWVTPGLAVVRDNHDAGLAYFALESQASQAQLAALSRIVYLQNVQGVLRLYASALAGKALGVRPLAELPAAFQSRLHQFPTTDGETIYLPPGVNRFPTHQENFALYRVMTAHQAGYLEFGTFAFALDELTSRLGPDYRPWGTAASSRPSATPSPAFRSDFERFFAGFPRPSVARDVFYCLEDGRIDYRLCHAYRGLAAHIERIIQDALASRPPIAGRPLWEAVFEVLIHLCSTGTPPVRLPRLLIPLARFLQAVAGRVRQPQATVYDAAYAAVEVYRLLEQLPNVRLSAMGDGSIEEEVIVAAEAWSREAALEASAQMMPTLPTGEEVAYQSPEPLPHQGEFQPEVIQRKLKVQELSDKLEQLSKAALPMPPELLRELLEQGIDLDLRGSSADELDDTAGLFVSDLEGKGLVDRVEPSRTPVAAEPDRVHDLLREELQRLEGGEAVYRYDEWDYLMRDYRVGWCLLREKAIEGEEEGFVANVLQEDATLISQIRRQFQLIKPELFKKLKRRDHGEEIDIDAAIEGVVDRRVTGVAPELVYIKRDKREREVSTVFLVDLSASTDDPLEPPSKPGPFTTRQAPHDPRSGFSGFVKDDGLYAPPFAADQPKPKGKRIIDVEKEALVVMAEALESIGDEYAIYGFSGYGRDNVEFFIVKEAGERYSDEVKRRIDAMKPHRSTRMGPPIRHVVQKLQRRAARIKTLILLSDGYPQDFDYGKDRRGKDYGIQDTKVALQEARRKGIHTFCITVDREGKSYLPEMCGADHFIVIENVARLPQLLPKIYRGLTT
jgi:nitric oxide reductase NorD protein